jgi:hypothetical protein
VSGLTGTNEANGSWRFTIVNSTKIDLVGSSFKNAFVSGGVVLPQIGYLRVIMNGGYVLETAKTATGFLPSAQIATFLGSISGTTLTLSGLNGYIVNNGTLVQGAGVAPHTYITGGSGTSYTVNISQTVSSTSMTGTVLPMVSAASTSYVAGDWVYFNGKTWIVVYADTSNVYLTDLDGNESTSDPFLVSNFNIARLYTLNTPYAGSDLAMLKFTQSADTMTLCHTSYPPKDLTRTGHAAWTLSDITFAPILSAPTGLTVTQMGGGTGTGWYRYQVTACSLTTGEESVASSYFELGQAYTIASDSSIINKLTWTAVPNADFYRIYKAQFNKSSTSASPFTGGEAYG